MNSSLLLLINGWAGKHHLLDTTMIFCARYLIYLVFLLTIGCVIYLIYKKERRSSVYFFASLVATFILLQIASRLNFDHRPFMDHHLTQLVTHTAGKSFPSDHTTATAGIAFGLLFFTRFKKIGIFLIFIAALIGFSRVFVGIHYPLDIIGGIITGLLGAVVVLVSKMLIDSRAKNHTRQSHENLDQ